MERSNCPGKAQSWWPLSHSLPRDGCAILGKESTAEFLTVGTCQWQKVGTTDPAAYRSEKVTTLPGPVLLPAGMVFPGTFQTHQPLSSCALKVFKGTEPSRGAGSLAKTDHVPAGHTPRPMGNIYPGPLIPQAWKGSCGLCALADPGYLINAWLFSSPGPQALSARHPWASHSWSQCSSQSSE